METHQQETAIGSEQEQAVFTKTFEENVKQYYEKKGRSNKKHVEFSKRVENVLLRFVHEHSTTMNHVEIDLKTRYLCGMPCAIGAIPDGQQEERNEDFL